ncbi:MAG: hypothetical protein OXF98_11645, partial [Rhodospirillaceae bacterium]|nr:hypothetical protein [Rhodospirillaceae bacterium]
FEAMIRESFIVLLPNSSDFDRALECLAHFETGLRAAHALHLAIAGNRSAEAIYSLDKLMIAAGNTLGLPASAGPLAGCRDLRLPCNYSSCYGLILTGVRSFSVDGYARGS